VSDISREQVIEFLKGKTIADIEHSTYLHWFTIDSIAFTDGSILELGGNADYAHIDGVQKEDGDWIGIDNSDLD
jgi:hypothetical protein